MKKYSLIPIMLLFSSLIFGQGIYNNGGKIVVGSGVTLTVSGLGGNYLNETGGSLNLLGTIKLEGNLTNNAAADVIGTAGAGSKIELVGSAVQTIGGTTSAAFTFPDLVVSNASGVTFEKDATVTGALTLTNGLVNIGNNNFTLGAAATIAGSPSASNMIVATGSGQVQKAWTAAGSFTFPVGDNTGTAEYSPVTLSFGSGTFAPGAVVGLSLSNTKNSSPTVAGSYLNRYWTLSETGITSFNSNIVLQYVTADVVGTESKISTFRVSPTPVNFFDPANTGLHQLSASGLAALGTFTGGETLIAPVASNNQILCFGSSAVDLTATAASGGSGVFSYQWQNSTDNINWIDITNEINLALSSGPLFETTFYRIIATEANFTNPIISNVVIVTVNNPITPPVLTADQTLCYNSAPEILTATPSAGGTGPFNYIWQKKTTGSWSTIAGENGLSYQPGTLTTTTSYQVITIDTGNPSCGVLFSNAITINVQTTPVAGSISGDQAICSGSAPSVLTSGTLGSGSGTISYRWESSADGNTWTPTTGTAASLTPEALTATTHFRRITISTLNGIDCESVPTVAVTVSVNPNASIVLSSTLGTDVQILCNNTLLADITYAIDGGGTGAEVSGLPTGVDGDFTAGVFTISGTPSVGGTFTYTVATTGTCVQATATGTITVNGLPSAAGTIAGSSTFTPNTSGVTYSVGTITNATSYAWAYSGLGVIINGTGNSVTLDFAAGATDGILTVKGTNDCGDGAASSLNLSNAKTLDVRVFLEGPYNGTNAMSTTLNSNALIPLSSETAYPSATYNYTASTVTSIPNLDIVDWVLVELRDAATPETAFPATKLAGWPKAYFLKADGSIVDVDGTSFPDIGNVAVANNLYVVIRHRNHIDIMSASGLNLTGNSYNYDFSTAVLQAYNGTAGYKQIGTEVFGMVAGDSDANGDIGLNDYSLWAISVGLFQYLSGDNDLNGDIGLNDYSKWAVNVGISNIITKSGNIDIKPESHFSYKSQVPK